MLTIINICFQLRNWKALCENALLISKRRAQLKQVLSSSQTYLDVFSCLASSFVFPVSTYSHSLRNFFIFVLIQAISALVQEAMSYIESAPDLETKIELIKTLTNVTAGKVKKKLFCHTILEA